MTEKFILANALINELRGAQKPLTAEEIAEATGVRVNSVKRALGVLVKSRDARKAGGGKFVAASLKGA